jgi:hypothetical protein
VTFPAESRPNEAKRLRELEEENRRLKRLVADQALNLQRCVGTKVVTPGQRRAAITHAKRTAAINERREHCRHAFLPR